MDDGEEGYRESKSVKVLVTEEIMETLGHHQFDSFTLLLVESFFCFPPPLRCPSFFKPDEMFFLCFVCLPSVFAVVGTESFDVPNVIEVISATRSSSGGKSSAATPTVPPPPTNRMVGSGSKSKSVPVDELSATRASRVPFLTGSKLNVALLGDGDGGSIGMFSIAGAGSSIMSVMSDFAGCGNESTSSAGVDTAGETGRGTSAAPLVALSVTSAL